MAAAAGEPAKPLTSDEEDRLANLLWESSARAFQGGHYDDALLGYRYLASSLPHHALALPSLKQAMICCDRLGQRDLAAEFRVRIQAGEAANRQ